MEVEQFTYGKRFQQTVAVITDSGQQIAAWKWNNSPMVSALSARHHCKRPAKNSCLEVE
jgi:hypothetical protein